MKNFYNRLNFNHTSVLRHLQHWLNQVTPCLLCGATPARRPDIRPQHTVSLCHDCLSQLPWYHTPRCPQCALPSHAGARCGTCLQHAPAFDETLTVFRYGFPLDRLLHQFKYQQHLVWGQLLAECMLQQLPAFACPPDMIMAMPMHPQRLRQRGFNHALALAQTVHQAWQIPLAVHGCRRLTDTPSQAGLDMKTRTRNLRGAFASTGHWHGQHVLLVDDVMTTGASMHALADVIKRAGASRVTALVLARTLQPGES